MNSLSVSLCFFGNNNFLKELKTYFLNNNSNITKLDYSSNFLFLSDIDILTDIIILNKLADINLSDNNLSYITEDSFYKISVVISKAFNLIKLNLAFNQLNDVYCCMLIENLIINDNKTLVSLELNNNNLKGIRFFNLLSDYLQINTEAFENINLKDNKIQDEDISEFFTDFLSLCINKTNKQKTTKSSIVTNLKQINLKNNFISINSINKLKTIEHNMIKVKLFSDKLREEYKQSKSSFEAFKNYSNIILI